MSDSTEADELLSEVSELKNNKTQSQFCIPMNRVKFSLSSSQNKDTGEASYIRKNVLILKEGVWNGFSYSDKEIEKSIWQLDGLPVFLNHEDTKVQNYIGYLSNPCYDKEKKGAYADLYVYDEQMGMMLSKGGLVAGLSPTLGADTDFKKSPPIQSNLLFSNVGLVLNPAQGHEAMITDNSTRARMLVSNIKEKGRFAMADNEETDNAGSASVLREVLNKLSTVEQNIKTLGEGLEEKKKEKYPAPAKDEDEEEKKKKEKMSGETTEENVVSLSAYTDFIADYMKKTEGATIKDAAVAWKKKKGSKKEELEATIEELEADKSKLSEQLKKYQDTEHDKLAEKVLETEKKIGMIAEDNSEARLEELKKSTITQLEALSEQLGHAESTLKALESEQSPGKRVSKLSNTQEGQQQQHKLEAKQTEEDIDSAMFNSMKEGVS